MLAYLRPSNAVYYISVMFSDARKEMLSEARGGLLRMQSEAKEEKLSVAWNKTSATLSPSHVKRPRDDDTRDASADLTATLPWEEKVTPTTTAPPQCFQNLPRRKRDRIVGQKYIYNELVCS